MRKRNVKQICAQMLLFIMVFMLFVPVADAAALTSVNIDGNPVKVITVNKVVMVKAEDLVGNLSGAKSEGVSSGTMQIVQGDRRLFVAAGTKYAYLTTGVGTDSPSQKTVTLRIAPVTRTINGAATLYVPYQDIVRHLGGTLQTNAATSSGEVAKTDLDWDGTVNFRDVAGVGANEASFKAGGASFPNVLYTGASKPGEGGAVYDADAWVQKYMNISKDISTTDTYGQNQTAPTGAKVDKLDGSGFGIDSVMGRINNWGGSDDPLPTAEMGNYAMIPSAMGGVAIITNVKGLDGKRLNLTADIVADIYTGKITKWNDARIKKINPGVAKNLPNAAITVVYRTGGSGTSYCFTSWLASAAPKNWTDGAQDKIETYVKAPAKAGQGNGAGVVGAVAGTGAGATTNAIGYVSTGDITLTTDPHSTVETNRIKNRAGNYVYPSTSTVMAAGASASSMYKHPVDTTNAASYPIVAFTWIIAEKNVEKAKEAWTFKNPATDGATIARPALDKNDATPGGGAEKIAAHKKSMLVLKDFVNWAIVEGFGDQYAKENGFVPLTPNLKARIPAILDTVNTML